MRRVAAALLLYSVIASTALASEPQPTTVEIQVDGLACPFCAFGIEKRLKKVPGVTKVQGDVKNGQAIVEIEAGTAPDPAALAEAVKRAGFTARGMRATVAGTISEGALKLHGGSVLSLSGKIPSEGRQVIVTARLHANEEEASVLEVEHAHEVKPDEE